MTRFPGHPIAVGWYLSVYCLRPPEMLSTLNRDKLPNILDFHVCPQTVLGIHTIRERGWTD